MGWLAQRPGMMQREEPDLGNNTFSPPPAAIDAIDAIAVGCFMERAEYFLFRAGEE
jgi:hypothetical protein